MSLHRPLPDDAAQKYPALSFGEKQGEKSPFRAAAASPQMGKKNLKKSIASFYKYFLPISYKCLVCEPRQEQGLLGQLFSSLSLASPASSSDAG